MTNEVLKHLSDLAMYNGAIAGSAEALQLARGENWDHVSDYIVDRAEKQQKSLEFLTEILLDPTS